MFRTFLLVLLAIPIGFSACSRTSTLDGGWACEQILEPPPPAYAKKIDVDVCPPDVDRATHPECIKKERESCPSGVMFRFGMNSDLVTGRASMMGRYENDAKTLARLTIDSKSTPNRLILGIGNDMLNGIYKLEGDHLTLKFPVWPNQPAPKEFGLEPGFTQVELIRRDDILPSS